jgi:hypothetical protein
MLVERLAMVAEDHHDRVVEELRLFEIVEDPLYLRIHHIEVVVVAVQAVFDSREYTVLLAEIDVGPVRDIAVVDREERPVSGPAQAVDEEGDGLDLVLAVLVLGDAGGDFVVPEKLPEPEFCMKPFGKNQSSEPGVTRNESYSLPRNVASDGIVTSSFVQNICSFGSG